MENLVPVDILMLEHVKKGLSTSYQFPQYWNYNYNVNPKDIIIKLINLGFISETIDIELNLNSVTIPILKDFLKYNNLKVSGNKSDLIKRILTEADKNTITQSFDDTSYSISGEALEILNKNPHILYAHNSEAVGFTINLANELHKQHPYLTPFELAWKHITSSNETLLKKGDWGLFRNNLGQMSSIMKSEKDILEALKYNILLHHLDLSGLSNGITPERIQMQIDHDWDSSFYMPSINDHYMKDLLDYKYHLNLTEEEFSVLFFDTVKTLSLPYQFLEDEEVLKIINYHFVSDFNSIESVLASAKERLLNFIEESKINRPKSNVRKGSTINVSISSNEVKKEIEETAVRRKEIDNVESKNEKGFLKNILNLFKNN